MGDAIDQLAAQTGVPIEIEPTTFSLLPYDVKTAVSLTIKGKPLREGLTDLLRPIGLTFDLEDQRVMIRPIPALRRIVGRASWKELGLLEMLCSSPWSGELGKSLKVQFQGSPLSSADVNREALLHMAAGVGQGPACEVLEHATGQYGWTWHAEGDVIVVLPKSLQIERQLERRITIDYAQTSLQNALLDLTETAGVPLRLDPGALTSVSPAIAEGFNLKLVNTTVRQALELIAGKTGLAYYIEPDGVRITANAGCATGSGGSADTAGNTAERTAKILRESSVVAQIELPVGKDGHKITILVRRSELPPDVNDMIKNVIQNSIEPLRLALRATSQPSN